ncbi:histidine phosphatase family protein [Nitrospirillum iridis]|uniref:Broad specificity phosphatase PhoE n=1 Tax=Nitrospirillum iridis TaxID=765888 RepID=A0A7X0AV96_9PROT|nr:histidine phosphatase family protein [Nitrospirillum iridis]MBB6250715.1 broad specificity phosphatase PhoE [Nitrospirillum iridis]
MSKLTLYFIRHAEKPEGAWPGPGLTLDGKKDKESLVIRGWQRAGAWSALFGAGLDEGDYATPQAVYAATPGAADQLNKGPSRRPFETATPLAARLGVPLNTTYGKGEEAALVQELLGLSGVVLVCWEHEAVVEAILPLLPIRRGKPPTAWPEDRFDVVLRLKRKKAEEAFTFKELYPRLLSGDSDTPL